MLEGDCYDIQEGGGSTAVLGCLLLYNYMPLTSSSWREGYRWGGISVGCSCLEALLGCLP